MRYFLKKFKNFFKFLIRVKRSEASKTEKLQLILGTLISISRIKRLYFIAKVLYDFLIIKKNRQSVYKLKHLTNGLENATKTNPIPDKDILRIAEAFIKAKNAQTGQPQPYQIGGEWKIIIERCHQNLSIELEEGNAHKIREILSNFGRDENHFGILPSGAVPNTVTEKLAYLNGMNKGYHNWKKLASLPDEVLEYPKEIGNLPGIEINGKLVPISAFRSSYFADKICHLVKSIDHPIIVEIGGGFGEIPYHIFRHGDSECTYMDFDIPEICAIASYFLMSNFPDKRILLYGESSIGNIDLGQYDIIIMPNYAAKELSEKCCDLVFNSHSLGEMDYSTVREYLRQVNRVCRKYFLHANDERRLLYWTPNNTLRRRVNLNNPDFELPRENFKRLYRVPETIYNDGGYTSSGFDKSYFEYLYERISGVPKVVEK